MRKVPKKWDVEDDHFGTFVFDTTTDEETARRGMVIPGDTHWKNNYEIWHATSS